MLYPVAKKLHFALPSHEQKINKPSVIADLQKMQKLANGGVTKPVLQFKSFLVRFVVGRWNLDVWGLSYSSLEQALIFRGAPPQ